MILSKDKIPRLNSLQAVMQLFRCTFGLVSPSVPSLKEWGGEYFDRPVHTQHHSLGFTRIWIQRKLRA